MTEYKTKEQKMKFYKSKEWKRTREYILDRDNYECAECKRLGYVTTNENTKLDVDHIKEIYTHPELALEPDNLQLLCVRHHNEKHNRWIGTKKKPKFMNEERW